MTAPLPLAVITGGTRGLGRALSLEFGKRGWRVTAIYRSRAEDANALRAEFEARGIPGQCLQVDVTGDGPLPDLLSEPGGDLLLVNNACHAFEPKPAHLLSADDFDNQMAVAVKGSVRMFHALAPAMLRAGRGTVVQVLSRVVSDSPPKGFAAYTAGKFAALGLARAWAAEYRERGLRFICVSPGFMDTPLTAAWSPHLRAAVARAGRLEDPADVAARIADLAAAPGVEGRGEIHEV